MADAGAVLQNGVMKLVGSPATPGHYEMLSPANQTITYTRAWPSQTSGGGPGSPIPPTSAGKHSVILDGSGVSYIESDHAFDGKYVYVGVHNHPTNFTANCTEAKPGCTGGGAIQTPLYKLGYNTTFSATDPITGKVAWTTFIPLPFRGGVTATGSGANEILLAPEFDGNIYVYSASTGQLVTKVYLGSVMNVEASVGATTGDQEQVFVQTGGGGATTAILGPYANTPGVLVALGLPAGGTSSGSASVSTSTSTTTVISTVGVNTVTTTVSSGGIDTTTLYAVAAVAVIAIIAEVGLAVTRSRRGP
jgi:hypothetical protein